MTTEFASVIGQKLKPDSLSECTSNASNSADKKQRTLLQKENGI